MLYAGYVPYSSLKALNVGVCEKKWDWDGWGNEVTFLGSQLKLKMN